MTRITALIVAFILTGCATVYEIEHCEGSVCAKGRAKTYRKFEEFRFIADFERGTLELSGKKVATDRSPLEQAAANIISSLPLILNQAPNVQE